jgi:hypothetical protein
VAHSKAASEDAAVVRLRAGVRRRVRVPPGWELPSVTESNCVMATWRGEQLEVKG